MQSCNNKVGDVGSEAIVEAVALVVDVIDGEAPEFCQTDDGELREARGFAGQAVDDAEEWDT